MSDKPYTSIVRFTEGLLERYGDCHLGVGWTKRPEDADTRYRVMLELLDGEARRPVTLLDFGCGASHLYEHLQKQELTDIAYSGLDISPRFLELSRRKFPHIEYFDIDVLEDDTALPMFDYIVMNGLFTAKCDLSFEAMLMYFQNMILRVFAKARRGLAFNVMSKQVDWERDDLFHLPFDVLASFLAREVRRYFVIRHDYGLYEYTTYVYRDPR